VPEEENISSNKEEVNIFTLEKQAEIQMDEGSNRQGSTVTGRGQQ
jgi:hypothetical protein